MSKTILCVALGSLLFLALLYATQDRLLYFPTRPLEATPRKIGLPFAEVSLRTADGETLHGWFVPAAPGGATLLFFHGNAGNISHRLDSLRIFHDLGLNVFIFDYRGYGQSSGRPSEEGTYRDAEAAWRYLTEVRHLAPQEIVLFGRSLGGSVAAWLAIRTVPRALILESTPTSVPDLAADLYPWLPARWLSRFRYDALAALQKARCPILLIHSPEDEIIPFAHAEQLFAAAAAPKQLLRIRGDHNGGFLLSGPLYRNGLRDFLAALP